MSIHAVARESGVSIATVSRVFNSPELVRDEIRARVHAVAARMRYQPNASARTLRTQRSRVIGVVMPTLLNPVFAECLQGVATAARHAGYSIVPHTTEYRIDAEERAVSQLTAAGVDGMVLVVSNPRTSKVLARLRSAGLRYVLAYNRHASHPCVSVDGNEAMAAAVRELVERGHRRIAMISGQLSASDRAQQRHGGYLSGMKAAGLDPSLLEVPFVDAAGDAIQALLKSRGAPTAIVCSNDLLAIRAMRAAHRCGLGVPHDVSIIGFDGIAIGAELALELGTIVQPNESIGESAARLLVESINEGRPLDAAASITFPWSFRPGETCGAAPRSARTKVPSTNRRAKETP